MKDKIDGVVSGCANQVTARVAGSTAPSRVDSIVNGAAKSAGYGSQTNMQNDSVLSGASKSAVGGIK